MSKVILTTDNVSMEAEFNESPTASKITSVLPATSRVNTWGGEIYFDIPEVGSGTDKGTLDVTKGDVAFWPEGNCLCVFYGRTPASISDEPVPASEVILVGKIVKGLDNISGIKNGDRVTIDVL